MTIGELDFSSVDEIVKEPAVRVVEHYRWVGKKHTELYGQMVDILKNVWRCRRVAVDATGVGEPVAAFLKKALGSRVTPFTFTQSSKSELGFNLLAAVNSGRLKMYAGDGSEEYKEFWREMELARSQYRASQTMNFYVDPSQGPRRLSDEPGAGGGGGAGVRGEEGEGSMKNSPLSPGGRDRGEGALRWVKGGLVVESAPPAEPVAKQEDDHRPNADNGLECPGREGTGASAGRIERPGAAPRDWRSRRRRWP